MSEATMCPERLARLREAAEEMEEALREEGFDRQGSHAVFVRWQRESVECLATIIVEAEKTLAARVDEVCAEIGEISQQFRNDQLRRAEVLLGAGKQTLDMARQAALTAAAASDRAESEVEKSVVKIAKDLSVKLLDECQHWLVLKQTAHNRRDAWRLAAGVAAVALGVFAGGYWMAERREAQASDERQAIVDAVERCWKKPLVVRDTSGQPLELCRLGDIYRPGG